MFFDLVVNDLIGEFETTQCHIKVCYCGFAYNGEDIYCLISKHKINGKENTRFGNKTQILGMKRSYYYKNLTAYEDWLKEDYEKEVEE